MARIHRFTLAFSFVLAALAGCGQGFEIRDYPSPASLYDASLREFNGENWDNAVRGFEQVTLQLAARDTLLASALYYLGMAHERRGEHLLAAQSLTRLAETFSTDTLADDALFGAAQSYQRMWRKPELDSEYGESAVQTYELLLRSYPDTPRRTEAEAGIARLEEWFARKDYENGMHYFRRGADYSAIIYFQDVVNRYPEADAARRSRLRMVESYRRVNDQEQVAAHCQELRRLYPADGSVREVCGAPPPATAATTATP